MQSMLGGALLHQRVLLPEGDTLEVGIAVQRNATAQHTLTHVINRGKGSRKTS